MSLGLGAKLVPNWFSYVFTYVGKNHVKQGHFSAIVVVMETGFAVTVFLANFLNLLLGEEIEDEAASITADETDAAADRAEWARIEKGHELGSRQGTPNDIEMGGRSQHGISTLQSYDCMYGVGSEVLSRTRT